MGFFGLGWLGIHKFMMGRSSQGVLMIIVSVVTCGIGAAVFTVISLIEGIIYLVKSDADFDRDYRYGSKDWF
jgi:TM2 domain-containing membrane protein YozV